MRDLLELALRRDIRPFNRSFKRPPPLAAVRQIMEPSRLSGRSKEGEGNAILRGRLYEPHRCDNSSNTGTGTRRLRHRAGAAGDVACDAAAGCWDIADCACACRTISIAGSDAGHR